MTIEILLRTIPISKLLFRALEIFEIRNFNYYFTQKYGIISELINNRQSLHEMRT